MRDIIKLLFGDSDSDGREPEGWDQPGRRARVGDSREWCGSTPGEDALGELSAALGGRGRRARHVVVVRSRRLF
jgi:hypothetical protein